MGNHPGRTDDQTDPNKNVDVPRPPAPPAPPAPPPAPPGKNG